MSGLRYDRILAGTAPALILATTPFVFGGKAQDIDKMVTAPTAPAAAVAPAPVVAAEPAPAAAAEPAATAAPGLAATTEQAAAPDPMAALDPADRAVAEKIRDR